MKPISVILIISLVGGLIISFLYLQPNAEAPIVLSITESIATPAATQSSEIYQPIPDSITAQGVVIIDLNNNIIAARNPHQRFMPASTTKIMTALTAFAKYDLNEVVTISRSSQAIGKSTHFPVDSQFTVESLLQALLINSGNDAAIALADHYSDGYDAFVEQMNQQATSWGLKDTHFTNVSGVESNYHYTSAADLATLAIKLLNNPFLRETVASKQGSITSVDKRYTLSFENTNELLDEIEGVKGIKTGWTDNSGECLVTYVDRDTDYIFVVLQSQDRFNDTKQLIQWLYSPSDL